MELLDLTDLENRSSSEQLLIKKDIIQTHDLSSIPPAYLPKVHTKNYFFVSYSHLDYKEVYFDIFDLQQEGLSIWYDRGMVAGESWKDTASKYIIPFECKGVLFYLSENALLSNAVKEEIKFVRSTNKPYIVVLLSKVDASLTSLIERLLYEGKIDKKTKRFFKKAFPDEVIYIKRSENIKKKRDLIVNSIPAQPVLDLDSTDINAYYNGDDLEISGYTLIVRGLNDYYVKNLTPKDFVNFMGSQMSKKQINESMSPLTKNTRSKVNEYVSKHLLQLTLDNIETLKITPSAFSNMKNLTDVELPLGHGKGNSIGPYAFYRCDSLKKVSFAQAFQKVMVGAYAFAGCKSLSRFDFSNIIFDGESLFEDCYGLKTAILSKNMGNEMIPCSTFKNCKSLRKVVFDDHIYTIGADAFYASGIKKLTTPKHLLTIEPYAFSSCSKLEEIILNDELDSIGMNSFSECNSLKSVRFPSSLKVIGQEAFANCRNLVNAYLPSAIERIEEAAFYNCDSLVNVYYDGDSENFLKTVRDRPDSSFSSSKTDVSIICLDKTIVIKKHL